jgi:NAD(P)-dependent dehydrogenase (short-subunit alcohol dehydrogenase family)
MESNVNDLAQRVALVTGGGHGIARAAALALAARGAMVTIADSDAIAAEHVAAEIRDCGQHADSLVVDVSREGDCDRMVASLLARHDRLDIAVNCAGITGPSALTAEYPLSDWDRVLAVNLTGTFYCLTRQIPAMVASGGGAIVNVASVLGLTGAFGGSAYSAAKHGVIGLTKSAALEYGSSGIRLNVVCPGYVRTRLTVGDDATISPKILDGKVRRTALKRLGETAELGEVIAWLVSPGASFVTGTVVTADGGFLAG